MTGQRGIKNVVADTPEIRTRFERFHRDGDLSETQSYIHLIYSHQSLYGIATTCLTTWVPHHPTIYKKRMICGLLTPQIRKL